MTQRRTNGTTRMVQFRKMNWNCWRPSCHVFANGAHLVGDFENGNVYSLEMDAYTDHGDPDQARTNIADGQFSAVEAVLLHDPGADGNGVADETTPDPQLVLRYSNDGGHSWSDERTVTMGKVGEYGMRAIFRRLGCGRNRVWEISTTDPVKFAGDRRRLSSTRMAALSLFPSRVAFVDAMAVANAWRIPGLDGVFYSRVGGSFGDQGIDVFGGSLSSSIDALASEIVSQPIDVEINPETVVQSPIDQSQPVEMVFQPPVIGSAIHRITPGASPYTYRTQMEGTLSIVGGTMSTLSLTRAGVSVSLAVSTPMIPLSPGDAVTITYTVAPALKLIPR